MECEKQFFKNRGKNKKSKRTQILLVVIVVVILVFANNKDAKKEENNNSAKKGEKKCLQEHCGGSGGFSFQTRPDVILTCTTNRDYV